MRHSPGDRLAAWLQYALPKHLLTAIAWRLSRIRAGWFRRAFIAGFVRLFGVDLGEAERSETADYSCFNDFFTRALKPGARPLADERHRLICPCDGTVSNLGEIDGDTLIQAKHIHYRASALLGSRERALAFEGGRFITVYLAPRDYHRVHSPIAGRVQEEVRIPGDLFSVSARTVRTVPNLFARNERMVAMLETDQGPVGVVMVAAMLVAGIETAWGGPDRRRPAREVRVNKTIDYPLGRGDELGRFHWGSTVIVLVPSGFPLWHHALKPETRVQLGQPLSRPTA